MLVESFRLLSARLLPRRPGGKQAWLALAMILAGCGGSSAQTQARVVRGDGYRFSAPAGWHVQRSAQGASASHGDVDRVEVRTFRLVKAYRPQLFRAASRELDRVASDLAGQLKGRVDRSDTVRTAGREARSYRIVYGGETQEITFVLDGRREYQLLCRRKADGDDAACKTLVRSFALA
jgi:hypothetical protein